jgi:hypothetical protein
VSWFWTLFVLNESSFFNIVLMLLNFYTFYLLSIDRLIKKLEVSMGPRCGSIPIVKG